MHKKGLENFFKWFENISIDQTFRFVATIIITVIITKALEGSISLGISAIAVVIIIFSLFAAFTLRKIHQAVTEHLWKSQQAVTEHLSLSALTVKIHRGGEKHDSAELYTPLINRIAEAKKSVSILGSFRSSTLPFSANRHDYYNSIEKLLKEKDKLDADFLYRRIVQVEEIIAEGINSNQIDQLTFNHCKFISGLKNERTSLTLHLRQIPKILEPISFVIIDDTEVIIFLPEFKLNTKTSELDRVRLGIGLFFVDSDGFLVREMNRLFDVLFMNSDVICDARDT